MGLTESNEERLSWRKILIVSIIALVVLILGIFVLRENIKKDIIKIQLSNDDEIIVVTSKKKVSEILEESNIRLAANETVFPPLDGKVTSAKTIKITLVETSKVNNVEVVEQLGNVSENTEEQTNKRETTLTLLEAMAFDIITEDLSNGDKNNIKKIIQHGKIGLKEITYKVTYIDEQEVSREELSSRVVRKPVDHIIRVEQATVAAVSRVSEASTSDVRVTESVDFTALLPEEYVVTAYCACMQCCGKTDGITASGTKATANYTIAASNIFAFGTQLRINGVLYTVEDRGGAIQGNRLDIYMNTHEEALKWGVRVLRVEIVCDIYCI